MPQINASKFLCIGCGTCSVLCPQKCISYSENQLGQYKAQVDEKKCVGCKLCENVCPMLSDITEKQNPGLKYKLEVGFYDECFKGFDEEYRKTSASGGLLTSCLSEILKRNIVDSVICVGPNSESGNFYKYCIIDNPSDLKKYSLSAYYPLHIDEAINYILKNEGKYCMIVLPCQAKGIRMLQKRNRTLRERLKFLLGLVCGGMPGKGMVEYICNDRGIPLKEVTKISFREKRIHHRCDEYAISLYHNENKTFSGLKNDSFGFVYLNKFFHYQGCNVCNDIFAEYADAVFMDAWLPKEREEEYGTSIVVTRNSIITFLLKDKVRNNRNIEIVDISLAVKAQNNVGLVQRKKRQSYFKMSFYKLLGYVGPRYDNPNFTFIERCKYFLRFVQEYLIQVYVAKLWGDFKAGKISFNTLKYNLQRYVKLIKFI